MLLARVSFMANQEHLDILKKGVEVWNQWREEHPEVEPDLSSTDNTIGPLIGIDLNGVNLSRTDLRDITLIGKKLFDVNLSEANLHRATLAGARLHNVNMYSADLSSADLNGAYSGADLRRAELSSTHINDIDYAKLEVMDLEEGIYYEEANLSHSNLKEANLSGVNLSKVDLHHANLQGADLSETNLRETDLCGADLRGANLINASLVDANLENANITGSSIYGISAWNVNLKNTAQTNLIITRPDEPTITVDNLKVAQFIYLLLNNEEIRDAINTLTMKVVLILGRFTKERKAILDTLRDELRKHNYLPILFDFEKPASRDLTETISILAHLARFIIVDLTDPSSVPHEMATIIQQCIVPVQPILLWDDAQPRHEYVMFHDLRTRYHWVLPTYQYKNITSLLVSLKERVIDPAEQKTKELAER